MIGLTGKTLCSKRLTYRLLAGSDRDALAPLLADRRVTEPAGYLPAASRAEFDEFFAELTQENTGIAILLRGTLIGYFHVFAYRPDQPEYHGEACVSVGFVIGRQYQNRGYATEALETLTAYLKGRFAFCFASHFAENMASKRVIEKCGYRYLETYTMYFEDLERDVTCLGYVC